MKKNSFVGAAIDKLAGNDIAFEKQKISKLQAMLGIAQIESEKYEKDKEHSAKLGLTVLLFIFGGLFVILIRDLMSDTHHDIVSGNSYDIHGGEVFFVIKFLFSTPLGLGILAVIIPATLTFVSWVFASPPDKN